MLFKQKFLEQIARDKVRLAFRKWTRPSVKESGSLLTPVGQLRIQSLKKVSYGEISDEDISEAGYRNREELDKELNIRDNGDIYRISFLLEQEDPRIELRENTAISEEELTELLQKLGRLDSRGQIKDWTLKVLKAVSEEPGQHAIQYATKLGYEKEWFKLNIRKLKNLGLTISLSDGYEISPRGKALLQKIG